MSDVVVRQPGQNGSVTSRHDLFVVDPSEFVALRDELARELRTCGDKTGAAEIKKLRRPAIAVWALNRVATDRSDLVSGLVAASDRAREVQRAMLEGADADEFRFARTDRRAAMAAVAVAAATEITKSGRSADTYARDIEHALNVVVTSAELGAALRASELPGLTTDAADLTEMFADVQLPARSPTRRSTPDGAPEPEPKARKPHADRAHEPAGPGPALLRARAEAKRVGEELAAATQNLERADAAVVRAEAASEQASRKVEEVVTDRDRARAHRDDVAARLSESQARAKTRE